MTEAFAAADRAWMAHALSLAAKGVYTADPEKDPTATFLPQVSYKEVLTKGLRVMDATAISLCMENDIPILVFKMGDRGNLRKALLGEDVGTLVGSGSE